MKRTLLTLTLAAALCLPALFAQKSAAGEPIVLTFNLGMPPIHQRWVNAIKPWCDELEKRSIKIEPYFANALGKRSDAMDSVRTGIADLAEAPFSSNPGAFPFHSQIFSAANPSMALGNAYEMLSDFYKAHPEVLKKEIKGVKLMFIHAYPVGDCVMTKSAPILKLDDIKGKKLGFEGGGLRFETMQALGASVVGMNMSDLYQAMQGGIIDGIVMDFDPLISRRYGEEVKHVTLLNITGTAFYVVMNQERYDSPTTSRPSSTICPRITAPIFWKSSGLKTCTAASRSGSRKWAAPSMSCPTRIMPAPTSWPPSRRRRGSSRSTRPAIGAPNWRRRSTSWKPSISRRGVSLKPTVTSSSSKPSVPNGGGGSPPPNLPNQGLNL